jgi:hypothetical protein
MGRLGRLMAAIGFLGLTLGALREAAPGWDTAALAVGWALVAVATSGAAWGDRRRRPGRAAFAAAGALLLALPARPGVRAGGPLERALDAAHPRLCRPREHVAQLPRDRFDESYSAWAEAHPDAEGVTLGVAFDAGGSLMSVAWRTPTRDAFQGVGHAAAAVVAAAGAGGLAARLARRQARADPARASARERSR